MRRGFVKCAAALAAAFLTTISILQQVLEILKSKEVYYSMSITATKNNKLGTEPIPGLLFRMALPSVLAQVVNLLYNMVDRAFVGHIAGTGSLALAGLGIVLPITMIVTAFAQLIGAGGAPRAAIAMGEGHYEKAEQILGQCTCMLAGVSVALFIVFQVFCDPILTLFGANAQTLPYASAYLRIYLIGTFFVMIALGLNAFITNQGYAKTSMATTCVGALLNLILDPILIYGFDMGVVGAAVATVISQAVSALMVLGFLMSKKGFIHIRRKWFRLKKDLVILILALGSSPFTMGITECVVQLTYNISMAHYGYLYVSLQSILFSLIQFVWMPLNGFAQGASPIISYNYGAEQLDRSRETFRLLFLTDLLFSISAVAIIVAFPGAVLRIFSNDASLLNMGVLPLRVYILGMAAMGAQSACQNTFLALGQAKISMFLACLRKLFLIWPLALILPHLFGLGVWGLFLAEPIADFTAGIVTFTVFCLRSRKLLHAPDEADAGLRIRRRK